MSQHPSARSRVSRVPSEPEPTAEPEAPPVYKTARRYTHRACCCPASPAVMAIVPAGGGRPEPTDLLLCGHHYRASRIALAEWCATITDMRGYLLEDSDWPDAEK